ncbi:MAG: hypothetical protein EOO86_06640 [Pedobacter sp.]|nr:MAG: hypothetical protein EOO86_06640 [Pedobacter sp.]
MNEVFLLISAVISLFAPISFFVMASSVAYIKDYIKSRSNFDWETEYVKRKVLKRSDSDILFAAQEFVWQQMMKYKSRKKYDELKATWESVFVSLGSEFAVYHFNK